MEHALRTAEKPRPRSGHRASSEAPKVTAHVRPASQSVFRPTGDHCACGGSCPRCRDAAGAPGAANGEGESADWDIAGLVGPPQFTVSSATRTGPTFSSCRGFNWIVDWSTTGTNGFIVQEIINSGSITRCDGTSMANPNTPHYWEAWPVDGSGTVGEGGADLWFRAPRPATTGSWGMIGHAGFADALDPAAGFSRTAVPDSNGLRATTTEPTNLYPASLTRTKGGTWDCCNGNNTHTEV